MKHAYGLWRVITFLRRKFLFVKRGILGVELVQDSLRAELDRVDPETHQAPVDIRLPDSVPLDVPDLSYQNYGTVPSKMKLNNTGYTG